MKTTWVVERNVFDEKCFDEMIEHLKKENYPYHIVKVLPFVHTIEGKVPQIENPVVVYGSIGTQKLAIDHGWEPGVWTGDEISERNSVRNLGKMSLNHDANFCKISQALEYAKEYDGEEWFIKPDSDTKEFAGMIIKTDVFAEWYQQLIDIGYLEHNDFEVMISSPKKLGREWRLVVVFGEVVAYSIYRQYGIVKSERKIIPEVLVFANEVISRYNPFRVYVIDIAETPDGFKIIEYNTFNSAGLYACDVGKIIDSIEVGA